MLGAIVYLFVEVLNYLLTYEVLLGIKWKKDWKGYVLLFSIASLVQAVAYSAGHNGKIIYSWIPLATTVIGSLFLAEGKRWKSIVLLPFAYLISSVINVFGLILLENLLQISQLVILDSPWLSALAECFGPIVLGGYGYLTRSHEKEELIHTPAQYFLLLIGMGCLDMMVGFGQYAMKDDLVIPQKAGELLEWISLLGTYLFIVLFMWHQSSWKRAMKYQIQNERYHVFLGEQEKHIKRLLMEDEQRRKLRHDLNAHMLALHTFTEEKDWKGLQSYLQKMQNALAVGQTQKYTGISAVDAIINETEVQAQKAQIEWKFEREELLHSSMDAFDLCVVFSNLLSNALEASTNQEDNRFIRTTLSNVQNRIRLTVENSCNPGLTFKERPKTTKGNTNYHGLGLTNVEEIVKKYQGTISYHANAGIFCVDIIL
ncbi:MAG: ATP-binding protein [Acetatifactor sp.]|nr:ATP-binding protein [Acetatifactor sp.]